MRKTKKTEVDTGGRRGLRGPEDEFTLPALELWTKLPLELVGVRLLLFALKLNVLLLVLPLLLLLVLLLPVLSVLPLRRIWVEDDGGVVAVALLGGVVCELDVDVGGCTDVEFVPFGKCTVATVEEGDGFAVEAELIRVAGEPFKLEEDVEVGPKRLVESGGCGWEFVVSECEVVVVVVSG